MCRISQARTNPRWATSKMTCLVIWRRSTFGEWSWFTGWNQALLRKLRFLKKLLTTSRVCLVNLYKTWSRRFKNVRTSAKWIYSRWCLTASLWSLVRRHTTCSRSFISMILNFYSSHDGCSGRGNKTRGGKKWRKFLRFSILSTIQNLNRKFRTLLLRWGRWQELRDFWMRLIEWHLQTHWVRSMSKRTLCF